MPDTASLERLFDYRKNRHHLHLDDKILTAWNGLMIAAFSRASAVLGDACYLTAAKQATAFIKKQLTQHQQIFTSCRNGKRSNTSFLDDYAFYMFGLIELYRATWEPLYLEEAVGFAQSAIEEFYDNDLGAFFLYGKTAEQLLTKPKETYDGAMPSGNAVMYYNLLVLSKLKDLPQFTKTIEQHRAFMIAEASKSPTSHSFFLSALLLELHPQKQIVCVLRQESDWETVRQQLPSDALVTLLHQPTAEYPLHHDKTTFYVCEHHRCLPPSNQL